MSHQRWRASGGNKRRDPTRRNDDDDPDDLAAPLQCRRPMTGAQSTLHDRALQRQYPDRLDRRHQRYSAGNRVRADFRPKVLRSAQHFRSTVRSSSTASSSARLRRKRRRLRNGIIRLTYHNRHIWIAPELRADGHGRQETNLRDPIYHDDDVARERLKPCLAEGFCLWRDR
jgi:hypothetical protein